MKASTKCFLSVPMLVAGSIALSGCGRSASTPTTITYHQVGVCKLTRRRAAHSKRKINEGFTISKSNPSTIQSIITLSNSTQDAFMSTRPPWTGSLRASMAGIAVL